MFATYIDGKMATGSLICLCGNLTLVLVILKFIASFSPHIISKLKKFFSIVLGPVIRHVLDPPLIHPEQQYLPDIFITVYVEMI